MSKVRTLVTSPLSHQTLFVAIPGGCTSLHLHHLTSTRILCTVLYCTVLYCTVLYCTAPPSTSSTSHPLGYCVGPPARSRERCLHQPWSKTDFWYFPNIRSFTTFKVKVKANLHHLHHLHLHWIPEMLVEEVAKDTLRKPSKKHLLLGHRIKSFKSMWSNRVQFQLLV